MKLFTLGWLGEHPPSPPNKLITFPYHFIMLNYCFEQKRPHKFLPLPEMVFNATIAIGAMVAAQPLTTVVFSCPSSSMPTLLIYYIGHSLTQWLCWNLEPWNPNQTIQPIPNLEFSEFWPNFRSLTKFQNFDQISQFQLNFRISTKFQKFDQISEFEQDFRIWTRFRNFN